MNKNFTLQQLAIFTQNEKELLREVGLIQDKPSVSPRKSTIDNILNYSKALSIRPSKKVGHIEMLLN